MKFKHLIMVALSAMMMSSCSDFLREDLRNGVAEKDFYKTMNDCDMSLAYCYSTLSAKEFKYANWYSAFQMGCFITDEVQSFSSGGLGAISACLYGERESYIEDLWKREYAGINVHNRAIKGFENATCFPDEETRTAYIAEVKTLRALYYFNLMRFFGDVPLILEPAEYVNEAAITRTPSLQIYQQLIDDLKAAKEVLPLKTQATRPGQITKGTAAALLAKVYAQISGYPHYVNMWEECRQECEYVMGLNGSELTDKNGYALYESYFNLFHPDHEQTAEVILDAQYAEGSIFGSDLGTYFSGVGGPFNMGGRGGGLSAKLVPEHYQTLYKTSKDGVRDPRWDRNVGDMNIDSKSGTNILNKPGSAMYIKKFARLDTPDRGYINNWGGTGNPTNVIILRLADIYLLYAEAVNELNGGPTDEAYEYVNKVRRRAWGRDIDTPDENVDISGMDYTTFKNALIDERAVELCAEGHRRFDLVRWHILTERIKATSQPAAQNISAKHYLFPIPYNQIILNPNLTQNPGWGGGAEL